MSSPLSATATTSLGGRGQDDLVLANEVHGVRQQSESRVCGQFARRVQLLNMQRRWPRSIKRRLTS